MNKKYIRFALSLLICLCMLIPSFVFADSPTDEILSYQITADVNSDATVTFTYHIDWKVLVSDGIGPMSWVTVGIPNSCIVDSGAISNNISYVNYVSDYGSSLEIGFTDEYYKDEVCSFDFFVTLDNMYSVDAVKEGETVIYFTPGWFNEITVDEIIVRWNSTGLLSWSDGCLIEDGYNVWTASLGPGEKISLRLNYANDAFAFDTSKYVIQGDEGDYYESGIYEDSPSTVFFSGLVCLLIAFLVIRAFARAVKKGYESATGFAMGQTEKKITRTKVEYYDFCPGCGAPHEEGERNCKYCGRDMVKSEEIIEEESTNEDDKNAMKYDKAGEYRYGSNPNTFVRVNVVRVPVRIPTSGSSRSSSSSRSSGRGGSCAHSSCACACASCACACACACAGGGRAGCSTKDFYKTDLKLRQLEMMAKK